MFVRPKMGYVRAKIGLTGQFDRRQTGNYLQPCFCCHRLPRILRSLFFLRRVPLKHEKSSYLYSFFFMQILFDIFGVRDFLPSDAIIHWLAKHVCSDKDLETFCSDIIFIICGFDKKQLNEVNNTESIKR